jgi:hypothetical protein
MEKPHTITEQQDCLTLTLAQRRAFMRLSLEERRQLLGQQAEKMCKHYQQNLEWQEIQTGDLVD